MASTTLENFIVKSLTEIKEGLGDGFYLDKPIEFEVSVTTSVEASGKIDILIANLGGGADHEVIQKIKFSVGSKESLDFKKKQTLVNLLEKSPSLALTQKF